MFILPAGTGTAPDLVISASDVVQAAACEYAAVRSLDARLGRVPSILRPVDPMAERMAALGVDHENRVLQEYRRRFGAGVVEIPEPASMDRRTLNDARDMTFNALRSGADVVYQASFFDGSFHGRADFLVRQPDGSYAVYDTKLAHSAKGSALLQIAAYADQLEAAGIPVAPQAHLILGTGRETVHELSDLIPVYRQAHGHLTQTLAAHRADDDEAEWGDSRWNACMKKDCPHCVEAITANDDLLMVRGMNKASRTRLIGLGITGFKQLLDADVPADDVKLVELREQARMQAGTAEVHGSRGGVSYQVKSPHRLFDIPEPDEGDIFFDFEGDPVYRNPDTGAAGLEYLFGLIVHDGAGTAYTGFTAHDPAQEKQALADFVAYVMDRLETYPDLRVYHYATYEATALRKLSVRHGILAAETEFIVENVLFDLLPVVRKSIRLSETSMSIKKLEPLYMDEVREGVTNGAASVAEYGAYHEALAAGDESAAEDIFEAIRAYNEYDCVSTLKLRDWLLALRG